MVTGKTAICLFKDGRNITNPAVIPSIDDDKIQREVMNGYYRAEGTSGRQKNLTVGSRM
jgi:hypothetical protein